MTRFIRLRPKNARVVRTNTIDWNAELLKQLALFNHVGWVGEHRFHPTRLWRFDLAHPGLRIAVEIEGLGPAGTQSHHQRADGFEGDCEKYAEAMILGWTVLRVTTRQVRKGIALAWIERLIAVK